MVTFTDLRLSLLKLGLSHTPVVAHASLKAFGEVVGGAETVLRATLDSVWALVMPTFTYRTHDYAGSRSSRQWHDLRDRT